MNEDLTNDPTHKDSADKTTQPTMTAIFRILTEVRDRQARLEDRQEAFESSVNSRFESLESRLDREFARIDTRFAKMSEEFKDELLQLSDKLCDRIDLIRVYTEAGDENLARRLRKLESQASRTPQDPL